MGLNRYSNMASFPMYVHLDTKVVINQKSKVAPTWKLFRSNKMLKRKETKSVTFLDTWRFTVYQQLHRSRFINNSCYTAHGLKVVLFLHFTTEVNFIYRHNIGNLKGCCVKAENWLLPSRNAATLVQGLSLVLQLNPFQVHDAEWNTRHSRYQRTYPNPEHFGCVHTSNPQQNPKSIHCKIRGLSAYFASD